VRAVALVGSYARGEARPDSDIDLVVLTVDVERVVADAELSRALGAEPVQAHREWGVLIERRFVLPEGIEVDVGVVPLSWAGDDPGTQRVVADGLQIIYDPDGLLAALISPG
jgi:predicted nucleotidyltransferase